MATHIILLLDIKEYAYSLTYSSSSDNRICVALINNSKAPEAIEINSNITTIENSLVLCWVTVKFPIDNGNSEIAAAQRVITNLTKSVMYPAKCFLNSTFEFLAPTLFIFPLVAGCFYRWRLKHTSIEGNLSSGVGI